MKELSSVERLCLSCFSEMREGSRFCDKCGFDNRLPKSPHHLPPRTILAGKYMVGRVLGEGGFGITYLGYDINLDIKVAIKEYYPSGFVTRESTSTNSVSPFTGRDGEYYESGKNKFLNEARALARFGDLGGIVEVRDFFLENSTAYIVMEYIEGKTLSAELKASPDGRLDAQDVISRMAPLVLSLAKIHETGLIHRDISPDNIMRDGKGRFRLLDFGAARDFTNDNKSVSVMLKPGYAPEEQYRTHGEQGPWTDCYAICATIYKLITGTTPQESLERLVSDTLVPPIQLGANITPEQNAAIMAGLSVHANTRFRSMTALYNALFSASRQPAPERGKAFYPDTQPVVPVDRPNEAATQGKPPKKKPNVALFVGIGAVAVAVVIGVILLTGGGSSEISVPTIDPGTVFDPGSTSVPTDVPVATNAPAATPKPAGTGELVIPDYGAFSGSYATDASRDGMTIYSYPFNSNTLVMYASYLQMYEKVDVSFPDGDTDVLYTVRNGDAYVDFAVSTDGNSVEIRVPSGVTLDGGDPDVSAQYLNENGLTVGAWMEAGASIYTNQDGIQYRGAGTGNSLNMSLVAMDDEYLYYCDYGGNGKIYKVSLTEENAEPEVLLDKATYARNFNLFYGSLYFSYYDSSSEQRCVYAIPTDRVSYDIGEPIVRRIDRFVVMADKIYYVDTENTGIYRCSLSGTGQELVLRGTSYYMNVMGDHITVADAEGETGIQVYSLAGNKQYSFDVDAYMVMEYGGFIYYTTGKSDGSKIYRVGAYEGAKPTLLCDTAASYLNTDGEDLFFMGYDDNCVYSVPLGGGTATKLADNASRVFVLVNEEYSMLFYIENGTDSAAGDDALYAYNWNTSQGVAFPLDS